MQIKKRKLFEIVIFHDVLFCSRKGQTFKIGGQFTSEDFYFLKFIVSKCMNGTAIENPWHPTCDTPQNIAKGVNPGNKATFYFSNNLINPEKPTEPVLTYLENIFFNL